MNTRKTVLLGLIIILTAFALGIYFYPQMPDKIASHWNAQGQVNGYMGKFWGLFFLPLLSLGFMLLLVALPRLDPLKHNLAEFQKQYNLFVLILVGFLFYLYLLTLLWNLRPSFRLPQYLAPGFGVLFYATGVMLRDAKPNRFIGIRTPWTLTNQRVWQKTHQLGSVLFKVSGGLSALGLLFPRYALWFVLGPVLITSLYLIIYSYQEFRKGDGKGN